MTEFITKNALELIAIVISIIALVSNYHIGKKQVKISEIQADFQNKVELYLLSQFIIKRDANGKTPDIKTPAIYIRNIGNNVVYLEDYIFNGRKYPIGKEALPPVSAYDGFRYIYLPTDGTTHVSLEINFLDWKDNPWVTKGYADYREGLWEISYSPCERRKS